MRKITMGLFSSRSQAEEAINRLQDDLDIDSGRISYMYKNTEGEVRDVDVDEMDERDIASGAKNGAAVGGTIGALAGIAAVAGVIPVVGPLVVAGPIASALGITTALGTTAAGAAAGAAAGGIIGALANMGVGEERAQYYSDRVKAGDILVAVETDADMDKQIGTVLEDAGALEVSSYKVIT